MGNNCPYRDFMGKKAEKLPLLNGYFIYLRGFKPIKRVLKTLNI